MKAQFTKLQWQHFSLQIPLAMHLLVATGSLRRDATGATRGGAGVNLKKTNNAVHPSVLNKHHKSDDTHAHFDIFTSSL